MKVCPKVILACDPESALGRLMEARLQQAGYAVVLAARPEAQAFQGAGALIDLFPLEEESPSPASFWQGVRSRLEKAEKHGLAWRMVISAGAPFLPPAGFSPPPGAVWIQTGWLWGNVPGKEFLFWQKVARMSPVLPLRGDGSQPVFFTHSGDLVQGLVSLLAAAAPGAAGVFGVGHPEPVPFRDFLLMERLTCGRDVRFLRISPALGFLFGLLVPSGISRRLGAERLRAWERASRCPLPPLLFPTRRWVP